MNKIGKLGLAGLYLAGSLAAGCAAGRTYQNGDVCERMADSIRGDNEQEIVILEDYAPRNLANATICAEMKEQGCDIPEDLEQICGD